MQKSDSIAALAEALSKAQGEITGALKDSANPFFKSKYADLASCWDAARGPLSKHGLAVIQIPTYETDAASGQPQLVLETVLAHASGEWIAASLLLHPKDDTDQAMGSSISYGRRYALTSFCGIAQVDDDGNASSHRGDGLGPAARYAQEVAAQRSARPSLDVQKQAIDEYDQLPPPETPEPAPQPARAPITDHGPKIPPGQRSNAAPAPSEAVSPTASIRRATDKQVSLIRTRLDRAGVPEVDMFQAFEIPDWSSIKMAQVDKIIAWIGEFQP
jgi:hypothetical protein